MILKEKIKMLNGVEIPLLGLGTWLISDDIVSDVVGKALKHGYIHIDTAEAYQNERGVGVGIKKANISRDEVFIQTKLAAEIKNYEEAKKAIEESLRKLNVDYIDLMIIHCPEPWDKFRCGNHYFEGNLEAWHALEEYYEMGKIKAIGVSNFEIVDLENIINHAKIKPMVNQILTHIGNTPFQLIDYCKKQGIVVEAYSPIAHGRILENKALKEMEKKDQVSVAQLCIRYTLQLGMVSLPKTVHEEYLIANSRVDFTISDEDMKTLIAMNESNE